MATKKSAKKAEQVAKEPEYKKQLDYDGTEETVDITKHTVKIECKDPDCKQIRYIKPQDAFQVKYCKPHQKKYARRSSKSGKKTASKAQAAAKRATKKTGSRRSKRPEAEASATA